MSVSNNYYFVAGAASKSDRVVRREVCSVITKGMCVSVRCTKYYLLESLSQLLTGTRTLSFFEGCSNCESLYLLALKENLKGDGIEYGVCFLDTCIGTIHVRLLLSMFSGVTVGCNYRLASLKMMVRVLDSEHYWPTILQVMCYMRGEDCPLVPTISLIYYCHLASRNSLFLVC